MRWIHEPQPEEKVSALVVDAGVSPVLAELLLRNGIEDAAEAGHFLKPRLADLGDPFVIPNLKEAVERLKKAIAGKERVMVLGDYDVDGVTSTALLVSALRKFGCAPEFVVPRRMEDGYGLSMSAIERALEKELPELFVALDCGTNSQKEIEYLMGKGIDVLVIDHHRTKEELPTGKAILVNPHVHGTEGDEDWKNLCTVGLVFKLVHGLVKALRQEGNAEAGGVDLKEDLDLAAMGTVADLVPLSGENRILARHGLKVLQKTRRLGLQALMEVAGVVPENGLQPVDISFRLGPRINASGRLADAAVSVELLLSKDRGFCEEMAERLNEFNSDRQEIEREMTAEAEATVNELYAKDAGIVLYGEEWHPGVVGIVAGRITRKYNRPCVVLGNEGVLAKGSGRSVDGLNLVEIVGKCCERLESWGGHPMAIGISMGKDAVDEFRGEFAKAVAEARAGRNAEATLSISSWIQAEQISEGLLEELDDMQPFGQGNPKPTFGVRGVVLTQAEVFKELHYRFSFEDGLGRRHFGVAWKAADKLPPVGVPVDLAVDLVWNHFRNRKLIQLELHDWRPAKG